MRRTVTTRKVSDAGAVTVRAGEKILGTVTNLASTSGEGMDGAFSHRPSFADVSQVFLELERALARGPEGEAATEALRGELEDLHVQVWHSVHDMRIDQRRSLAIVGGRVQFRATDSFIMMRTGGL